MSERSEYGPREYLSDDRDLEETCLIIDQGGNGDWYVKIVRPGERVGVAVRVTTSGAHRGAEHVAGAVFALYRALGGEDPGAEHERLALAAATLVHALDVDDHLEFGDLPTMLEGLAERVSSLPPEIRSRLYAAMEGGR